MKFIKFPEATSSITLPVIGEIPFVKADDKVGVMCLELTDKEIAELKANKNRLFIIAPLVPPFFDRPIHITLSTRDVFKKRPPSNGQDKKD